MRLVQGEGEGEDSKLPNAAESDTQSIPTCKNAWSSLA